MVAFWAKVVVFGQKGCIRANWFYLGNAVFFGQSGCIQQSGCIRTEEVEFGQKWLYSGKVVVFLAK